LLEYGNRYVTFLKKVLFAAVMSFFMLTILHRLSLVHLLQLVRLPSYICLFLFQTNCCFLKALPEKEKIALIGLYMPGSTQSSFFGIYGFYYST